MQYIYQKAGTKVNSPILPRVLPLITPRFIPTCTPELLTSLGHMAQAEDCHITSHISESLDEVAWSLALEKQDSGVERTDAQVFDRHGLLTRQCIMAHGVWLNESDASLLRTRGTAVAHCPLSNFFFADTCLPCRDLLTAGNLVGLGTDVAGGYQPSMMDSCRMAVVASRAFDQQRRHPTNSSAVDQKKPTAVMDYRHAFYLATLGGAESLNLQDYLGNFAVGKQMDAVILSPGQNIFINDTDELADVFQKICNLGDDRNVRQVYVAGRQVV